MENNELYHYGVLGMRWGVRRGSSSSSGTSGFKKKTIKDSKSTKIVKKKTSTAKKSSSENKPMTDAELRAKIARLQLEKQYKELSKPAEQAKANKGKEFVTSVLRDAGKNIATQAAANAMGIMTNKIAKSFGYEGDFVNPKKGQKDK